MYELKTEIFTFLSLFHLRVPVDNLYVHVFHSCTFAVKHPRNLTHKKSHEWKAMEYEIFPNLSIKWDLFINCYFLKLLPLEYTFD